MEPTVLLIMRKSDKDKIFSVPGKDSKHYIATFSFSEAINLIKTGRFNIQTVICDEDFIDGYGNDIRSIRYVFSGNLIILMHCTNWTNCKKILGFGATDYILKKELNREAISHSIDTCNARKIFTRTLGESAYRLKLLNA